MKSKIVGIVQSNFVPWQGYFDFIRSCDEFILFDDVQYTERDWRNRNRLRTDQGFKWINVPVHFSRNSPTSIEQTKINYSSDWIKPMVDLIKHSYRRAPNCEPYANEFIQLLEKSPETISELNESLIRWACSKLDIKTKISQAREYSATGVKTDRLMDLLLKSEATVYISGPAARDYIENDKFKDKKIELRYKNYSYPPYTQVHGDFMSGLSILDLFMNMGADSKKYIESLVLDERVLF